MPSKITKNGRTRWKGRVQKNGEIRQKQCDTMKEARDWEAEERKKDWSKTDTEYTLNDWSQQYLDYAEKFSSKAYGEKKKAFKEFFAAKDEKGRFIVTPEMEVNELTPGMVLKTLQIQFRNRSGYAANKDRKNLVAAWNWGIKYLGLSKINPCLVDTFPEERSPRYVPPEEDFWKVMKQTQGQDEVMLLTFLHLGARRGEIFRLVWQDIDFTSGRVRLFTRKRKDGTLEYDWLPMTTELKSKLLWWWENRKFKNEPYVFLCEHEYCFCREVYGKPFTNRQHLMKRLCKKAKVERFGFHAIRHLTASILYQLGKPVGIIQSILRHKSASTTERYLRSIGLEETRSHLEELCGREKRGEVVNIKDRLENRSQAV